MSERTVELTRLLNSDNEADTIVNLWSYYYDQKKTFVEEYKELRNYLFATDTSNTTNNQLSWSNTTTIPKLTNIRDNLHSNYLSALFPNDNWLKWQAYSQEDAMVEKSRAIEAYMDNKTREGGTRKVLSDLLYDYIDFGNAFSTVSYEDIVNEVDGEPISSFVGPKMKRISPLDIVFDPTAVDFGSTWKIVRSLKTLGELMEIAEDEPDNAYIKNALDRHGKIRNFLGVHGIEDSDKEQGFFIDGFGSMLEYFTSGYVEVLEFWGDFSDGDTVRRNRVVSIIDRKFVMRDVEMPNWFRQAPIYKVGWRTRPDNLWSMGPLANLVGMQYKIDSYENAKADAIDLAILPPLVISGEVEEFDYRPGAEINIDEAGSIVELGRNLNGVMVAGNEIANLEARMEMFAGAPREAMGIRSPGEKTAFEVQALENAAGRIFQEKITTFEIELLEPTLNAMLEIAKRNLDTVDVVKVMDDDLGVTAFLSVSKEDITAKGKIRPLGARHFAQNAQLIQNLGGLFNSQMGQIVAPHISSKQLAKLLEGAFGLDRFELFKPNIAVEEQVETQQLAGQLQEDAGQAMQQGLEDDPSLNPQPQQVPPQ